MMKDFNIIQHKKNLGTSVKDVDLKSRTVSGYFSAFGNVDSAGDIMMPGAYKKSIKEQGTEGKNLIFHLDQHDPKYILGKPHVLKEDSHGLYFETKISETSYGLDVLKLYEDNLINQHSVGFYYVKDKVKKNSDGNYEVLEARLFEGSTVTWGANENTPSTGFKNSGLSQLEYVASLKSDLDYYMKSVKVGNLTDETYRKFELTIAKILKDINTISEEPSLRDTLEKPVDQTTKSETESGIDYEYILNQLKSKENGTSKKSRE